MHIYCRQLHLFGNQVNFTVTLSKVFLRNNISKNVFTSETIRSFLALCLALSLLAQTCRLTQCKVVGVFWGHYFRFDVNAVNNNFGEYKANYPEYPSPYPLLRL